MPAPRPPLRSPLLLASALLVAGWSSSCAEDKAVEPESTSPRVAALEPFIEVDVDERWRSLAAYNARVEGEPDAGSIAQLNGHHTLWHANGVKKGEGEFSNGLKQGPWIWWYDSGQRRWEGSYEDDRPEGLEKSFFENGQQEYEGTFHDERRDGPWQRWYDTGQLAVRGHYEDGKREGEFRYWGYDGELDRERSGVYADDVKVAELPD